MIEQKQVKVVTSFIKKGEKILIVRRSNRVGSYRGKWSGISGYLEDEPLNQAIKEIEEETGIRKKDLILIREGTPLPVFDGEKKWLVYPFLFRVKEDIEPELDWENVEYKWIDPEDLDLFDTVPGLKDAYERLK